MSDVTTSYSQLDGRVARRERNRTAVLDVVLEMFAEDQLFPTIEQASSRSGLSPRSVYRYFADPGELLEATIVRSFDQSRGVTHLHAIGAGPLEDRLQAFCESRVRLHGVSGAVWRATVYNAARHERLRGELEANRGRKRDQFAKQFAPELVAMPADKHQRVLAAGDVLTQLDSIDLLRRSNGLESDVVIDVLVSALGALLRS
jgi:AcrR family transcriptional regulator